MHFAAHTLVGESVHRPVPLPRRQRHQRPEPAASGSRPRRAQGHPLVHGQSVRRARADPDRRGRAYRPRQPLRREQAHSERILHWLDRTAGLRSCALRYFNAAGATRPAIGEDHDPETHLIPLVLQAAAAARSASRSSAPTTRRPTAPASATTSTSTTSPTRTSSPSSSDRGAAPTISATAPASASARSSIRPVRSPVGRIPTVAGPRRAGDPATLVASSEKIRRELGWKPSYPELSAILESAWSWHRRHPQGYAGGGR